MNKVDTEYKSLSEVPSAVVQFYEEETRERIVGHTEPDEDGNSEPIKESYIVVVLNKPNTVLYSFVESRIGRRHPKEAVKAALVDAIAWEEFYYNHDLVFKHQEDLEQWQSEEPQAADYDDSDIFAGEHRAWFDRKPELPVIDMAVRREYYELTTIQFDTNVYISLGTTTVYDDVALTGEIVDHIERKSPEKVAAYYREHAKHLREDMKLENIFVHGHYFQVRQEDRNNMDETIAFAKRHDRMDDATEWITVGNNPITLTYHQIEAIKDAYVLRMAELFKQYSTWCTGDMQNPFEFVEATYE